MPAASRTPFGMRKTIVDTARGRVVCLRNQADTTDRPVAIMVNGLVETKERWSPALVHMARAGYDAYAYDHIGQFESGGHDDPERYTVPALTEDLLAVLEEISPTHPVHLVGGCFGGFVARHVTSLAPHRVRSLVLLGSGTSLATSNIPDIHLDMAALIGRGGTEAVFEEVRTQALRAGISERSVRRVRSAYIDTRPAFLVGFSRSVAACPEARLPRRLPMLIVHGSTDMMWSTQQQRAMAHRFGAPLEIIPGAGHSPTVTHPRTTAEVLTRFWQRADADAPLPETTLDSTLA